MPAAGPFFNKASIESGPGIRMMPRDVAAETTLMALKYLGIGKNEWRNLLEAPVEKLLAAQTGLPQQSTRRRSANHERRSQGNGWRLASGRIRANR
jgi:para-nitrobenzyl esterase